MLDSSGKENTMVDDVISGNKELTTSIKRKLWEKTEYKNRFSQLL